MEGEKEKRKKKKKKRTACHQETSPDDGPTVDVIPHWNLRAVVTEIAGMRKAFFPRIADRYALVTPSFAISVGLT